MKERVEMCVIQIRAHLFSKCVICDFMRVIAIRVCVLQAEISYCKENVFVQSRKTTDNILWNSLLFFHIFR